VRGLSRFVTPQLPTVTSRARPAAPHRSRPRAPRPAQASEAELQEVVGSALLGGDAESVAVLDEILSAGGWEDVQATVRQLATEGRVTPALLSTARAALERAQAGPPGETQAAVAASLGAVVQLVEATLGALQKLAPKAALAEAVTQLDPEVPSELAQIKALFATAFAGGGVDRLDFVEDMVFFLQTADEQDAGLVAAVANGEVDLGGATLTEVMAVRRAGRARMDQLVSIATGMA